MSIYEMEQETLMEHLPACALVVENLLSWALTTTEAGLNCQASMAAFCSPF